MLSDMTTNILLVPGFWLGGWAWDAVADDLQRRGDLVTAVTLPGMDAADDRSAVSLDDQARALLAAADNAGAGKTVLVAHSGAAAPATLATDLDPNAFARVIYVDTAPLPDGFTIFDDLDPTATEVPLPSWEELTAAGNSLEGLDEAALTTFRERSVPVPAQVAGGKLELKNVARNGVPTTIVCSSFPSFAVQQMRDEGHPLGLALRDIDADYVDLPTGHWPMWSKPAELAEIIHAAANR